MLSGNKHVANLRQLIRLERRRRRRRPVITCCVMHHGCQQVGADAAAAATAFHRVARPRRSYIVVQWRPVSGDIKY